MNRQNLFLFAVISGMLYVATFQGGGSSYTVTVREQGSQIDATPSFEGNGSSYADVKAQADNYLSGVNGTWVTVTEVSDGEGSIPIG